MKFKLDENLPADLAMVLGKEGHDASSVAQEGLSGEDDSVILKAATHEGRIVLSFDLDFADIRKYPPGSHSGIVVFRLHDQRWQTLEGPVRRLLGEDLNRLQQGLAIVDESRVRFRRVSRKKRQS